jgi:hypothetical protein
MTLRLEAKRPTNKKVIRLAEPFFTFLLLLTNQLTKQKRKQSPAFGYSYL